MQIGSKWRKTGRFSGKSARNLPGLNKPSQVYFFPGKNGPDFDRI